MAHAATAWSAGLLCLFTVGCWSQSGLRSANVSAPLPPPLPEGQQSLADLETTLQTGGPALVATLQTADRISDKSAGVKVTVAGVGLVDPQMVGSDPRWGQGHLHYQIDGGPVIATTATKLSFHDLTPGRHTIVVLLAGNDHRPLGPKRILTVSIPSDGKPSRGSARTRKNSAASQRTNEATASSR
jgi:hypothetical protein